MERALFLAQRLSALVLAPLVAVHLALVLWAIRDGLTAAEILGRTRGSWGWGLFYTVFVLAVAVHAPIGLRNILCEWTPMRRRAAALVAVVASLVLLLFGLRAVFAVTVGGG